MNIAGRHLSRSSLLICGIVVLGGVLAVATLGFGVAAWIILAGAFCVLMMGSMIWMMVAMGKHGTDRHKRASQ
jgi:hypothetical protein